MTSRTFPIGRQNGFTLVEAIMVIVITGIIAGIVAVFIRVPTASYVATEARADVADAADLALRRMSRELRLALPHSVNVAPDGRSIQFLLSKTGGRYLDINHGPPATLLPLDFVTQKTQFDMIGTAPTGRQAIVAGDYIVIANTGQGTANAYNFGTGADNVSRVAGIAGSRITLQQNLFAATQSAQQMFQVVTGTVTYVCTPAANGGGTLMRYFNRTIVTGFGNVAALGTGALLTNMVSGCTFNSTALGGQTSGSVMTMVLRMQQASGEGAQLVRQTQLDNPS